jgi:NADPH:quinone reductase-like Zn-dependent oxidoreductase
VGTLEPVVDSVIPFAAAHERLVRREHFGKVALVP